MKQVYISELFYHFTHSPCLNFFMSTISTVTSYLIYYSMPFFFIIPQVHLLPPLLLCTPSTSIYPYTSMDHRRILSPTTHSSCTCCCTLYIIYYLATTFIDNDDLEIIKSTRRGNIVSMTQYTLKHIRGMRPKDIFF